MNRAGGAAIRRKALRRGSFSESLAVWALRLGGYRIMTRNFRCPFGEIDIVARKGDTIAFVEVKARASVADAVNAVSAEAQHRITNAGEAWIGRQRDWEKLSWRFDIVAVIPRRWPVHLPDAF